ncbi:hypothetical protein ACFLZF_00055 [Nanoarchaeota archaeon]
MEKPNIFGIGSKEYPNGRIDKLSIEMHPDMPQVLINLFEELNFSDDVLNALDMNYTQLIGYHFFYSEKIKAHLFGDERSLTFVLDTNLDKEKLMDIIEKYFQLF